MERLLYVMTITLTVAITAVFLAMAAIIMLAPADMLADNMSQMRLFLVLAVLVLWVVIVCPLVVIYFLVRDRTRGERRARTSPHDQNDTQNRDLLPH